MSRAKKARVDATASLLSDTDFSYKQLRRQVTSFSNNVDSIASRISSEVCGATSSRIYSNVYSASDCRGVQ